MASWLKRISSSPGNSETSLADICLGDHLSASRAATKARRRGDDSTLRGLGLRAPSSAARCAGPAL